MSTHPAMLRKIQLARRELRLQEAEYRGLLARVAGTDSARDLSDRQAGAVIAEFKRLGWQPRESTRPPAERADIRKIYALWGALHSGPLDRDALRAWTKARFKVSAPEFLKPPAARQAIEQLKAWQQRLTDERAQR
ncbi:regulatory protein GemA [Bosea minatitlanensis]|uniref:Phage protein GemA/Gp16 family protein n=1 Tax=Bosea minatitlanensis TaxID=128782 RepID=A0ABW0F236_9HYPH|nr:regulatory protein GemA [Bosea minatitlanensis]MCT4491785.1 regulatory protein GemA [Bosea minatitlanensis]